MKTSIIRIFILVLSLASSTLTNGKAFESDTLLIKKSKIGKERLLTVLVQVPDTAEDLDGSLSFYKSIVAYYSFRGKTHTSTMYESALADKQYHSLNLDTSWGKYLAFFPQYQALPNGNIVLRTFSLTNMFRSGACGSCDFYKESYYFFGSNQNQSKLVFEIDIDPSMGGARYTDFLKPNPMEKSLFEEDALSQPNYATSICLGQKGWKIIFDQFMDDNTTTIYPFDLAFQIIKGKLVTKFTPIEPQVIQNKP